MSRRISFVVITALVFLLSGAGTFGFLMWTHKNASPVSFTVNAQGWNEESSSPIPVHITGQTTDNDTVDTQYFIGRNNDNLMLEPGEYTAEVYASPVNENGGMYEAPEPIKIVVPEETSEPEKTDEPETQDSPDASDSDVPVVTAEITLTPVSPLVLTEEDREKAFEAMKDAGLSDEEIEKFISAVDKIVNSPAAKLSDEDLLNLLANAPLSPPDVDILGGNTTNYSNNMARGTKCYDDGFCYDMWLSGNGTISHEQACGSRNILDFNTEFGKPLIVDINNDGIRDILSLSFGDTCTGIEWNGVSNVNIVTIYTPNAEGTALEIMAHSESLWSEDSQAQLEHLIGSNDKMEDTLWAFREFYDQGGELITVTEPILHFEDGHIRAKMTRGHFHIRTDSPYDGYDFTELYTVTFEIQGNKLVPVEAKAE